jgi:hypothetical protein
MRMPDRIVAIPSGYRDGNPRGPASLSLQFVASGLKLRRSETPNCGLCTLIEYASVVICGCSLNMKAWR